MRASAIGSVAALAILALTACGEGAREATADTIGPLDARDTNDDALEGHDTTDTADTAETCPEVGRDPSDPEVVATDRGPVRGATKDGVRSWLAIPYAAPPIGPLRFRPPEPPACRDHILDAKALGPACPQLDSSDGDAFVGAEDCLTLNVWAPATPGPHAVLVFLHGGGNIQGSARETLPGGGLLYDGQYLARPLAAGGGEVVVVTVQYRLGALGWLVHPALTAEAEATPACPASSCPEDVIVTLGNRGLLDQQAALRWVRDNVAAFGGDPTRVLLFGESAGAVDTSLHLAMPSSRGLFHAAIVQSGSPITRTLAAASEEGEAAVASSPCGGAADVPACLRALPVEDLVRALPGSIGIGSLTLGNAPGRYGPVVDGRLVPDQPLTLIRAARAGPGPHPSVIVGSNSEELAELMVVAVPTAEAYEALVRANLATPIAAATGKSVALVTETLLATWPASSYPTPRDALVDIYSDLRFTCPALDLLHALEPPSADPSGPRRYLFSRRADGRNGPLPASHGRELVYVFGSWRNIPLYRPSDADARVSSAMLSAWASLATNAALAEPSPTVPLEGGWPGWSSASGATLVFDDPIEVQAAPREDRCATLAALLNP